MDKKFTLRDVPDVMRKRIVNSMIRTWNVIGYDVLVDMFEGGNQSKTIPRSHVIEIVTDAGYMKTYGNDDEAYDVMTRLPMSSIKNLGKIAFPEPRHGM